MHRFKGSFSASNQRSYHGCALGLMVASTVTAGLLRTYARTCTLASATPQHPSPEGDAGPRILAGAPAGGPVANRPSGLRRLRGHTNVPSDSPQHITTLRTSQGQKSEPPLQGPVLHWAGLTVAELGQAGWRALGRLAAGACGALKLAQAHLKVKHYFGRRPSRTARLTAPQDPEGTGVGKEREAHIQHGQAGPRRAPSRQGHTGR